MLHISNLFFVQIFDVEDKFVEIHFVLMIDIFALHRVEICTISELFIEFYLFIILG